MACPLTATRLPASVQPVDDVGRVVHRPKGVEELLAIMQCLVGPAVTERRVELRPKKLLPFGIGFESEFRRSVSAEGPHAVCIDPGRCSR